jgi:hypothetical protein
VVDSDLLPWLRTSGSSFYLQNGKRLRKTLLKGLPDLADSDFEKKSYRYVGNRNNPFVENSYTVRGNCRLLRHLEQLIDE